jgi:hypothetical protein
MKNIKKPAKETQRGARRAEVMEELRETREQIEQEIRRALGGNQ